MQMVCKGLINELNRGLKVNNGLLVQITMVTKAKQGDCSKEPGQCETTTRYSGGQTTQFTNWNCLGRILLSGQLSHDFIPCPTCIYVPDQLSVGQFPEI